MTRGVIQRPRDDGSFDELILKEANCHFEMLDNNQLWVGIDAGGKRYVMVITARGKLGISFREE